MEFDKTKVYTALNADESLIGAKGYFADTIRDLQIIVESSVNNYDKVEGIFNFYFVNENATKFNFFYLVKPAPEKYWVKESNGELSVIDKSSWEVLPDNLIKFNGSLDECRQYITEHSKPKYRRFRNCDELIKCYLDNCYKKRMSPNPNNFINEWIELPTIWVKDKIISDRKRLLQFDGDEVVMATTKMVEHISMSELFNKWEFLDGSVCGVEE